MLEIKNVSVQFSDENDVQAVEDVSLTVDEGQKIAKVDRELALELHLISILHVIRLLVCLSVQINDVVLDLQGLTRQAHIF